MTAVARNWRVGLILALPVVGILCLLLYGRMPQDEILPGYHNFADQRTFWGVPNFWNVVSNMPFLLVALAGLWRTRSSVFIENWERTSYRILLVALALVAVGSGYYHARPNNATLFWDRLPMAIVFTILLATTIGERIDPRRGGLLLFPLLAIGVISVLYWRFCDDLRLYVLVQAYAVVALPLLILLFPPRYSHTAGIVGMIVLYGLALALDHYDRQFAALAVTGGHPWKHVAAAAAMLCYVSTVTCRHLNTRRPSS